VMKRSRAGEKRARARIQVRPVAAMPLARLT
jgi:hypothetical protein